MTKLLSDIRFLLTGFAVTATVVILINFTSFSDTTAQESVQEVSPEPIFSWIAPTGFEGEPEGAGTLVPFKHLSKYTIRCSAPTDEIIIDITDVLSTKYTSSVGEFKPMQYTCVMTATAKWGSESLPSTPKDILVRRTEGVPGLVIINDIQ